MDLHLRKQYESVSSGHRIVTTKIGLNLRRNMARTTTVHYDWFLLNNRDIRDKYTFTLRKKFDALQEISETPPPNDENDNLVNVHLEAAAECLPTQQRAKPRIRRETLAVWKKHADIRIASLRIWRNSTNINTQKLKKAQKELANIYLKEQTEYKQNQINKMRESVEDRQSSWQTVNEVIRRKNTAKVKLEATSQEERIHLWNLLRKPPKVTHEPITKFINNQQDIKLGQFIRQEKLDSVLRKIKNRKTAGLDEIHPEVWRTREFDDILLRH